MVIVFSILNVVIDVILEMNKMHYVFLRCLSRKVNLLCLCMNITVNIYRLSYLDHDHVYILTK